MASKHIKIMLVFPLCFRAMAAWKQKIPVDITVEENQYHTDTIQEQTENRNSCCARSFLLKVRLDRRVNTRHKKVAIFILYGDC